MAVQKISIVTGGGSGVGRAAALALARGGWTVVVAGRRQDALDETVKLASGPGRIEALAANVSDPAAVDALFDAVIARHGRLDMLFNNAGLNVPNVPLDELAVDDLRRIIDVNLFGAMLCARAAMRVMRKQTPQGGRIINNGSISASTPRPFSAPYTSTKHAITGLTKSIALDGRAFNIAGSQIDIGNAATDMTTKMTTGVLQPDGTRKVEDRMPVSEVGEAVLHIANLPAGTNIPFLTIMATNMPLYGRG
jgi:NAD(P)-dependent dehydrogenase (short-subunit alcohol dehydrogenase family)